MSNLLILLTFGLREQQYCLEAGTGEFSNFATRTPLTRKGIKLFVKQVLVMSVFCAVSLSGMNIRQSSYRSKSHSSLPGLCPGDEMTIQHSWTNCDTNNLLSLVD